MMISTIKSAAAVTVGLALLVVAARLVTHQTMAAPDDRPTVLKRPEGPRAAPGKPEAKRASASLSLNPPAVATDPSVKLDYPIVYVRLLRQQKTRVWAQAGVPLQMNREAT